MRELHGWHGDRHRHARDAAADVHAKHAADSPRLQVTDTISANRNHGR
jgi:hypothetical protein